MLDLCKSLPGAFVQRVLVPSGPGSKAVDTVEGISVIRFRYFFKRLETLAYGSGILGNLKARPVRWLLVPFFLVGFALSLRRQLKQFDPDVIHAHWWFPAGFVACLTVAAARRRKLLITCHGADYFALGGRFPRLRRWVFERADKVALVSTSMHDHAVRLGFPTEKLAVAPMGVDLKETFRPPRAAQRKGVLYAGRLVDKKGVDTLLEAWARTPQTVRDSGLLIVGSGRSAESLQALARTLGVSDSVTFHGVAAHEQLAELYRLAELLVFPSSDQEGLGLVVIEAMGCNCPVLASDVASLTDVIVDGETGFVFPKGDATALAARLNELMADPERRADVAERGGDLARARFDWLIVGERYASLYRELVNRPG